MLETVELAGGDNNNNLAGKINFGIYGEEAELGGNERSTLFFAAYVWHFADWDVLTTFLEEKFGLRNARWVSDEYINPFDLL